MDDLAFMQKKPNVERRMETQGQRSGEMRRIHIVYFLSHKDRIEHPHLIRVHHLSRSGVRLQDVKRWLSELRGRDMPESYSWSYKRRYRTGYVWQDLVDEDLITPISDNEYVLKGSEIVHTSFDNDAHSFDQNKVPLMQTRSHFEIEDEEEDHTHSSKKPIRMSTQTSFEIEEEKLTVEVMKVQDTDNHDYDTNIRQSQSRKFENSVSSLYAILSNKKGNKRSENNSSKEKSSTMTSSILSSSPSSSSWSCSPSSFTKSKSYSGGTSHIFRNLMSCGAADTNDSATVKINRRGKSRFNVPSNSKSNDGAVEICKGERLRGSQRMSETPWNQHYHHHGTW